MKDELSEIITKIDTEYREICSQLKRKFKSLGEDPICFPSKQFGFKYRFIYLYSDSYRIDFQYKYKFLWISYYEWETVIRIPADGYYFEPLRGKTFEHLMPDLVESFHEYADMLIEKKKLEKNELYERLVKINKQE